MTTKRTTVIILMALAILWVACGKQVDKIQDTNNKDQVNPNGDSELAIVMRTMMDHGKQLKKDIEDSTELTPYPEEILTITTATPTDGMIENREVFNGFATYHLSTLDSIYVEGTDKVAKFNNMVTSCVDCHKNYCQGPIPAIKKLYISAQ